MRSHNHLKLELVIQIAVSHFRWSFLNKFFEHYLIEKGHCRFPFADRNVNCFLGETVQRLLVRRRRGRPQPGEVDGGTEEGETGPPRSAPQGRAADPAVRHLQGADLRADRRHPHRAVHRKGESHQPDSDSGERGGARLGRKREGESTVSG
jgi:hypothetical protein